MVDDDHLTDRLSMNYNINQVEINTIWETAKSQFEVKQRLKMMFTTIYYD